MQFIARLRWDSSLQPDLVWTFQKAKCPLAWVNHIRVMVLMACLWGKSTCVLKFCFHFLCGYVNKPPGFIEDAGPMKRNAMYSVVLLEFHSISYMGVSAMCLLMTPFSLWNEFQWVGVLGNKGRETWSTKRFACSKQMELGDYSREVQNKTVIMNGERRSVNPCWYKNGAPKSGVWIENGQVMLTLFYGTWISGYGVPSLGKYDWKGN